MKSQAMQCKTIAMKQGCPTQKSLLPVIEMLGWRQNLKELDKGNMKPLSYCHHYQNNSGWRPRDILSLEQCNLNISRGWEQYNSYLLSPIIHQRFPYSFSSYHPTASLCSTGIFSEATPLTRLKNGRQGHLADKSLGHQSVFVVK